MDDAVDIIKICQAFQHSQSDLANDVDVDGANLLVDTVKRSLVHVFHADADVGIGEEGAIK